MPLTVPVDREGRIAIGHAAGRMVRVSKWPGTTWGMPAAPAASRWMFYSKTWWDERVDAVSSVVEAVFSEPEEKEKKTIATPLQDLPNGGSGVDWAPFWAPKGFNLTRIYCK